MDFAGQLADGHQYLGYAIFVVVLGVVVWALTRQRAGAAYSEGLPRISGLLLALQFVYGIVVYVQVEAWNRTWLVAIAHPLLMLASVALAGISTARAGRAEDAAAWGAIARFQGLALVAVLLGIGAATAG